RHGGDLKMCHSEPQRRRGIPLRRGFLAALGMTLGAAQLVAQSVPDQLVQRELQSSQAYETLSHLTDDIGQRLSGSPGAASAVKFATERFRAWGIDVRNERVTVPHW